MLFRSSLSGMLLLLICLCLCGCYQGGEGQADEQKNPYFAVGKERLSGRDYKGAISAFEKALEGNPHSILTHFELAMLYDNHSDQKEEDFVAAMYHYNQVIKLRPNDYPADNARERIAYYKRELVKAEALAPVAQNLMHDLAKLKEENLLLRKQLDSCQLQIANRIIPQARPAVDRPERALPSPPPARLTNAPNGRISPLVSNRDRITPLPAVVPTGRTHTVKERETFFSIARQYHVKPEALTSANPAIDPKRLKVGQVINVPSM
jgi:tetratricopeptide (TPR) repeat protein